MSPDAQNDHVSADEMEPVKVVIVGAGFSGLSVAYHLQKEYENQNQRSERRRPVEIQILEARDRWGGRVHSVPSPSGSKSRWELGGQWIHEASDRNPLLPMLEDFNISLLYQQYYANDEESTTSESSTSSSSSTSSGSLAPNPSIRLLDTEDQEEGFRLYDRTTGTQVPTSMIRTANRFYYKTLQRARKRPTMDSSTSMGDLLRQAKEQRTATPTRFRQKKNNTENENINASSLDPILNYLQHRTEGYEGGPLEELSASLLLQQTNDPGGGLYQNLGGPDEIPVGGYGSVLEALRKRFESSESSAFSIQTHLSSTVCKISHSDNDGVSVYLENKVDAIKGDVCVCTLPLGVLQQKTGNNTDIELFDPPLPDKKVDNIHALGMGLLDKVVLEFPSKFWDCDCIGVVDQDLSKIQNFLDCTVDFGGETPVLIWFVGGKAAQDRLAKLSDTVIVDEAMTTLRRIYSQKDVPNPTSVHVTHWKADPFSRGSYSFTKVGCSPNVFDDLAAPVGRSLLFAGEHTSRISHATVHGAWGSGKREAERILRDHCGIPGSP